MKEYLKKRVKTNEIDEEIELQKIFAWTLINKDIKGYKTILYFERDTDIKNYNFYVELENKWKKEMKLISPYFIYISIAIAFILLSIYLFLFLNTLTFNLILFLSIFVPGLLFFLLAAGLFYLRTKRINYYVINYYEKRREYRLLSEKIKEKE